MSNIATNIVQSKHLLELGLDRKSADMFYPTDGSSFPEVCDYGDNMQADNPAWSLSALLDVMPPFIKGHHLEIAKTRFTDMWYLDYLYLTNSEPREDLLTAVYEMVVWLLEQGLIEKGGQDGN